MQIDEIKTVFLVGAGTMGCFNSLLTGIGGYDTVLFDVSEETLQLTGLTQEVIGAALVDQNIFTAAQVAEGRKHIRLETDPAVAAENADLLSESVPEKLEVKRAVHQQFDALCPPHTIMTTNTSSILISEIEDVVQRGDRFAAMHFHLLSTPVDLLGGPRTTTQTIDILYRFVKSLNCSPYINRKENIGYVYNAIFSGMTQAIAGMVIQNDERIEDVDRAWMINSKEQIGPFGLIDLVGINVYYDGVLNLSRYPHKQKMAEQMQKLLKPYVDRGELGMKTGKGIYTYPDTAYQNPEFLIADQQDNDRYQAMVNSIICHSLLVVIDDIVPAEEIDRVWMEVHHSEAGPFGWLDDKGIDCFLSEIKNPVYNGIYPTDRFEEIVAYLNH